MAAECPQPLKCRNCRQEGHMANDCPEPEKCRRCRQEGHKVDECPEPEKCFNCREEGHKTADCPEPIKCRRCKEEGHQVSECPKPMICNRCGEEGHMVRDCTGEEKTRTYTNDEGTEIEIYIPKEDVPEGDLFKQGITVGINFEKYEAIPVEVTGENAPQKIGKFEEANLRPLLLENIKKSSYKVPTPIQKYSIPILMAGRDLMGCAQTGSGKTASFLIPIINKLLESSADPSGGSVAAPQAVIVTPTRELADQIYHEARKFAAGSSLKARLAVGGTSTGFQSRRLMEGCNILVATTGRLKDFSEKKIVSFERLQFLVLDEADRMLDQGFMPDIEEVVGNDTMPPKEKRQTLLYSATFSDEVQEAAQEFLPDNYLFVSVGMVGALCSDVQQEFIKVDKDEKREKLEEILQHPDRDPQERTLIFVETKKSADFLCGNLCQEDLPATSIHGDRFQSQRYEALDDFKSGKKPILVATSVAARGLDISGVGCVINYDLPKEGREDEYVHRVGRTGRVGNPGKAISFVDETYDAELLAKLIPLCQKADVPIADWMNEIAESGGGGGDSDGGAAGGDDEDEW